MVNDLGNDIFPADPVVNVILGIGSGVEDIRLPGGGQPSGGGDDFQTDTKLARLQNGFLCHEKHLVSIDFGASIISSYAENINSDQSGIEWFGR